MKEHVIKTYYFDELSAAAKDKAWVNNGDLWDMWQSDEFSATLERFEKIFDVRVYDYRVGNGIYSPFIKFCTHLGGADADDNLGGDPLRVARYVWNNYAEYITTGKYYSTRGEYIDGKYTYKSRHSRVITTMSDCPLTGFWVDQEILQPVLDCLSYRRFFNSYYELIKACLDAFINVWDAEIEYYNSFEYFAEWATENEIEFLADGTQWRAAAC